MDKLKSAQESQAKTDNVYSLLATFEGPNSSLGTGDIFILNIIIYII